MSQILVKKLTQSTKQEILGDYIFDVPSNILKFNFDGKYIRPSNHKDCQIFWLSISQSLGKKKISSYDLFRNSFEVKVKRENDYEFEINVLDTHPLYFVDQNVTYNYFTTNYSVNAYVSLHSKN